MPPAWILSALLVAASAQAELLTFHAALNLADDAGPSIAAKGIRTRPRRGRDIFLSG